MRCCNFKSLKKPLQKDVMKKNLPVWRTRNRSSNTKDEGCFDCGAKDHWRGDPACPKRDGGKRGGKSFGKGCGGRSSSTSSVGSPNRGRFRPGNKHNVNVSEANVVDLLSPQSPVQFREVFFAEKSETHKINVAESLAGPTSFG